MKKIYFLTLTLLFTLSLQAQVTVTYQVDVTNYVAGGAVISANGLRVGGTFADLGATTGGNAMVNWSPSDANSAMTDLGNNIWSIDVTYPADQIGSQQLYKFVNGDWGMNEGTDPENLIAVDGCGVDDGAGNINRTFTIPSANATQKYCWDLCTNCDGSSNVTDLKAFSAFTVAPNPTTGIANFNFTLENNTEISISVYNLLGNKVAEVYNGTLAAGEHNTTTDLSALAGGVYFYRVQAGNAVSGGRLVKQ
jgi:Secretion system C-terminal sorting domain